MQSKMRLLQLQKTMLPSKLPKGDRYNNNNHYLVVMQWNIFIHQFLDLPILLQEYQENSRQSSIIRK